MKRFITSILCLFMILGLTACGNNKVQEDNVFSESVITEPENISQIENETASEVEENSKKKVLVAFFSMPDEVDDSTVVIDGETLGNTQYMAYVIQENTGADIFRIEAETPYPTNHDMLVDLAKEEQDNDSRPAIKDSIENLEEYETVFIGYPIWWSDMPMIMYTFFDTYDFSGKTIVPFSTHGGSSFAGTPDTIAELEPNAAILDGKTISREIIQDAEQDIVDWLRDIGYAK